MTSRTDTTNTTTIRIARPDDVPIVSGLLERAYAEYVTSFPWAGIWEPYYASVTDVAGRWGDSTLLIAERDGEVVGSVDYHAPSEGIYSDDATTDLIVPAHRSRVVLEPSWAAVRCLAVDPRHRGAGIAARLMHDLIDRANADGASLVFLHSIPVMAAAIRLYERLGFVRMTERDFQVAGAGAESDSALAFGLDIGGAR